MGKTREDPGMALGSSRLPGGLCVGDIQGGSWDALGILQTDWRAGCGGTSMEDPGMPLGSPRLPGGLCVGGHPGRILGYPWDLPACLRGLGVGGHPGRSLGSSGQHGELCVRTSREDPMMSSK